MCKPIAEALSADLMNGIFPSKTPHTKYEINSKIHDKLQISNKFTQCLLIHYFFSSSGT